MRKAIVKRAKAWALLLGAGTVVALCMSSMAHGQTAKVITLSPEDAKTAKALYAEQAEIAKKIAALREKIKTAYLYDDVQYDVPTAGCFQLYGVDPKSCPPSKPEPKKTYTRHELKQGFYGGDFQFSDDFKFIVPPPDTPHTSCVFGSGSSLGCGTTLTPMYSVSPV